MAEAKKLGLATDKSPFERGRKVHRAILNWDEAARKLTSKEAIAKLLEGEPRIAALPGPGGKGLEFTFLMNDPGEEKAVAKRLRELFG